MSTADGNGGGVQLDMDEGLSTLKTAVRGITSIVFTPVEALVGADSKSKSRSKKRSDRNKKTGGHPAKIAESSKAAPASRFSHQTQFAALQDDNGAGDFEAESDEVLQFDDLPSSAADTDETDTGEERSGSVEPARDTAVKGQPMRVMPRFASSTFWNVYGNKLRVFGTQEGVCSLPG